MSNPNDRRSYHDPPHPNGHAYVPPAQHPAPPYDIYNTNSTMMGAPSTAFPGQEAHQAHSAPRSSGRPPVSRPHTFLPPSPLHDGHIHNNPDFDHSLAEPGGGSTLGPAQPFTGVPSLNLNPLPQGTSTARIANSSSSKRLGGTMRIDSIKHYAGLLIAEKPLESHREYQRRVTAELTHPDPEALATTPAPRREGSLDDDPDAAAAAFADPSVHRVQNVSADAPADALANARVRPKGPPPLDAGPPAVHMSAEEKLRYEEYRKSYKTGRTYNLVRDQIIKNKRRRGRAKYLDTLKTIYNSIVPSSGRREPRPLTSQASFVAYAYLYAMLIFDFVTPVLLSANASLVTMFLASCLFFTMFFAAGQRQAWVAAVIPGPVDPGDVETGNDAAELRFGPTKLFGPARLWNTYVTGPETFQEVYLAEWGGIGPAVGKAAGQGWRYIAANFLHVNMKHLLTIGVAALIASTLVERRYGLMRTAMMSIMLCITGTTAAMLTLDDCAVTVGASPLAWGFLTWWAVDTGAKLTLYPWSDSAKLYKTLLLWKNWSNLALLLIAFLLLVISETSLRVSSSAGSIAGLLSALFITPIFAPRWSLSIIEASTVPVAILGVLVFWIIVPIAGSFKVASVTDEVVASCASTVLLRDS